MHPKNSNKQPVAQEALLTGHSDFYFQEISAEGVRSRPLLVVQAGEDVETALNSASMLLGAVDEIMTSLTDDGIQTDTIYGLRFLIESSKALMDSTTVAVMRAKIQGGGQ